MHTPRILVVLPLVGLVLACSSAYIEHDDPIVTNSNEELTFENDVLPFVRQNCTMCHHRMAPQGDLDLTQYDAAEQVARDAAIWREVAFRVSEGEMPPKGRKRPDALAQQKFLVWVRGALAEAEAAAPAASDAPSDPGRVTMRRLNRTEYRNTVRDLLGIDFTGGESFPADDVGYGYDNIGDVLSLQPLLMERYLDAAEQISEEVVIVDAGKRMRVRGSECPDTELSRPLDDGSRLMFSNDTITASMYVPLSGEYELRVSAWGQQAGPQPCRLRVLHGEKRLGDFDVSETRASPKIVELKVRLERGQQPISAAFINDYYQPNAKDPRQRDRNLAVRWIELRGPLGSSQMPEPHRRLFAADPGGDDDDARRDAVLRPLIERAFRRPVSDREVARFTGLAAGEQAAGESFERGIQVALQGVLVSPHFLFRVESHPAPGDASAVHPIDDHALATRLSYFLWSSMPDDTLRTAADRGELRDSLGRHVRRMLRDPRASSLVTNFGVQWLQLRLLDDALPDPDRFPEFDDALRRSMRIETESFLASVLAEDRPVTELLDARHTFMDGRLARHYGIEGVTGDTFLRVELPDDRRGGLLGQAALLTLTSYPTRTSPVKRGKWVLEQIVGRPTPPPPPGIGDLEESGGFGAGLTLRKRMERHRTDPTCNACHGRMDPIGFALENFDAIGRWRETDDGAVIDPAGTLPDGRAFSGPGELRSALLEDDSFVRNLARNLFVYGLGRGLTESDEFAIDRVVDGAARGGYRFHDLVEGVATSIPFGHHRGEELEGTR